MSADAFIALAVPQPLHPAFVTLVAAILFLAATYAGYPLVLLLRARIAPRPPRPAEGGRLPSVTCIVAAHDEGEALVRKIANLLALDYPAGLLDVVVADDGSKDGAPARARSLDPARVAISSSPARAGKPTALLRAVALARGEVLLLCDVRQRLDRAAARELVRPLGDPGVGAVTGQLLLDGARGPGAYWRYESAIRAAEGRTGSVMGATGAIYAIRRALFPRDLPPETILDDVYVPMALVLAGWRVAHAPGAVAFDRELDMRRELVRKVRTLAGNWQLVTLLPALANPLGGRGSFRFFWHKQARLLCPGALAAVLLASLLCPGAAADVVLGGQVALYGLAALAQAQGPRAGRVAALCHTFVALNAAAVAGLVVFLRGRAGVRWARTGTVAAR